jgi:hypothetical protein
MCTVLLLPGDNPTAVKEDISYKTGNIHINLTLRGVRVTIADVEKE